jgi:hypothetical protein
VSVPLANVIVIGARATGFGRSTRAGAGPVRIVDVDEEPLGYTPHNQVDDNNQSEADEDSLCRSSFACAVGVGRVTPSDIGGSPAFEASVGVRAPAGAARPSVA